MRHSSRFRAAVLVVATLAALLPAAAASAAEGPGEISVDGVTLRLVAEPATSGDTIRAALLVDLKPGWKTYWLDPGDAGIPPHLDLSASTNLVPLDAQFPLPHRVNDAGAMSNVYSQPFAVALTLRRPSVAEPSRIDLGVTLGLCREVCIPVDAHLALDLADGTPADARAVAYAFDMLPEPSTTQAGIQSARVTDEGRRIEVEVLVPDDRAITGSDLFLAAPAGWFFGAPAAPRRSGRRFVFDVPVTARPKSASTAASPPAIVATAMLGSHVYRAQDLPVAPAP